MDTKLDNLSEMSQFLSVKTRMSDDLFHRFGRFGICHLLSRLHWVSASELILSLSLFSASWVRASTVYANKRYMSFQIMVRTVSIG